jgi:flagellar hook-associated protein 3 FlgL
MQISTSQIFARSTSMMATLTKQADALQTQIATGLKYTAPSDDAAAYQRLAGIKQATAGDKTYSGNIDLAQSLLADSDATLGAIETQLGRAKELAVLANNGTASAADKSAIATELNAMVADLLALANTKDVRGQPIFGGSSGDSAYAVQADGSIAFVGTGTPAAIPIGDGVSVLATDSGARIFGGVKTKDGGESDMFAIIAGLAAALQSDTASSADAASDAIDDLTGALDQVSNARASIGARAYRMDFEAERLADVAISRESARAGLEDADPTTAIAELQKTLTVLQATQASFTKISQLSLFDYLN